MAASSRFFRRLAACLLVVLCAGTAAWICSRESCETLWAIVSSASSDESAVERSQPVRTGERQSALEVSAPINTAGRPVELSPQEKLNARVEAALDTVQPVDGGPSVSAGLSAAEAPSQILQKPEMEVMAARSN